MNDEVRMLLALRERGIMCVCERVNVCVRERRERKMLSVRESEKV